MTNDLVHQFVVTALSQLPGPVQQLLRTPLAKKTLAVLIALGLLRTINHRLSQWSLNNWRGNGPWRKERELILLTGGCSGIGRQVMEDLARTGVRVVILDVSGPTFQLPSNVFFYQADVTSSESIAKVARAIRSEHGEPTVLINNAGVAHEGTILEKPEAQIRQTLEVNTFSHFLMVKEFLPAMVRANHGHVITIASMASFIGLPEMTDYCCSKASALAFHEGLRQELRYWYKAPNVRTSVIHPSWVRTPMVKMLTDHEQDFPQRFMSVQVVSDAICKQVLTQNSGQIVVPSRDWVISTLRGMPSWLQEGIRSTASQLALKFREKQNRERLHK